MPRPGPTDVVPSLLTPGEAVLVPEVAEAVGRENIKAANERAVSKRKGIVPVQGYQNGSAAVKRNYAASTDLPGELSKKAIAQHEVRDELTTKGQGFFGNVNGSSDPNSPAITELSVGMEVPKNYEHIPGLNPRTAPLTLESQPRYVDVPSVAPGLNRQQVADVANGKVDDAVYQNSIDSALNRQFQGKPVFAGQAEAVQGYATGTDEVVGVPQYHNALAASTDSRAAAAQGTLDQIAQKNARASASAPMSTAATGGNQIYKSGNSYSDKPNMVNQSTGLTTVGGGTNGQSTANKFTNIAPPMVGMPGVSSSPADNNLAKQNLFARTDLDTAARLGKAGNMDAATGIMQDLNKAKPMTGSPLSQGTENRVSALESTFRKPNPAITTDMNIDSSDEDFTALSDQYGVQGYAEGADNVDFQPLSEKEKQDIVDYPLVAGSQNAARRISEGYSNSGSGIVPTTKGVIAGAARAVSDPWKAKLGLPDAPPTEPAVEQPKKGFMDTLSDIATKNAQVTAAIPGAVKSAGDKEMSLISDAATAVTRPQWGINPAPKVAEPTTKTAFQQEMADLSSGPSTDLAREKALQSKGGVQIKAKPTPSPEAQAEAKPTPGAINYAGNGNMEVDVTGDGKNTISSNNPALQAKLSKVAAGLQDRARKGIVPSAPKQSAAATAAGTTDFWYNNGYPGGAAQYKAEREQKALENMALNGGGTGNMTVTEFRRANAQQKAAQGILADRERATLQREHLATEGKKADATLAATGAEREYQHRKDLKESEQKQAEMEQRDRLAGDKPAKIGEDILPTRDVPAYQARKAHEAKVASLSDYVKKNSGLFSGSAEDALVEGLIQQGDQEGDKIAALKAYLEKADTPEEKSKYQKGLDQMINPYRSALNG